MRRFDGWEPRETTVYQHDDKGKLIRSVTTREPEWDAQQRAWAMAWLEHQAMTCTGCGCWLPEAVATDEDDFDVTSIRCGGCAAIATVQKQKVDAGQSHIHATRWLAVRR